MNLPVSPVPSLASLQRAGPARPTRITATLTLPFALLTALTLVLAFVFRDALRPARQVATARVLLLDAGGDGAAPLAASAELQFQASGWVEPDPWPLRATVLTDGVVRELLAKEGEAVRHGQPLARLDPDDARLDLDLRRSERETTAAALAAQRAAVEAAELALRASRFAEAAAVARLEEAADNFRRIEPLVPDKVPVVDLVEARRDRSVREAERQAASVAIASHEAELRRAQAEADRLVAALAAADKRIEVAALRLARMTVLAPADGVVLRRLVEPGAKRGLAMDDPDSATILTLFDPARLQVRVDVPLAEAGRLRLGQPCRIFSALLGNQQLTGTVTRIVGEADLQRNTLQAKVAVHHPDPRLRPEVLCRVEFWSEPDASAGAASAGAAEKRHTLWLPESALLQGPAGADAGDVWVVDPDRQTVARRAARLAPERRDGLRRVAEGLRANEIVVTRGHERLKEGVRVTPSLNAEEASREP